MLSDVKCIVSLTVSCDNFNFYSSNSSNFIQTTTHRLNPNTADTRPLHTTLFPVQRRTLLILYSTVLYCTSNTVRTVSFRQLYRQ